MVGGERGRRAAACQGRWGEAAGSRGGGGETTISRGESNVSEVGVSAVKNHACDKLLASRVDLRVSTNKTDSVMNRLQVFYPTARDGIVREAFVPESV